MAYEIILPEISDKSFVAFNRFPVVFKELNAREKVENALYERGIITSRMYLRPLHHIFDLGYAEHDFPNAVYLAERLLTLPSHPFVDERCLDTIIDVIRGVIKK